MASCTYSTKDSVMRRAQELVNARKTFGELDVSNRLSSRNKGDLGQIVEEGWYGYRPNNDAEPDFAEAGVELKVSPYKNTRKGVSAKERLVCDIINYMEEVGKTFETSAFWHKCKCICLLSYHWSDGVAKADMFVDHATLLEEYPTEDLLIIKQDWEIIIAKIRAGQAHLLTEGDTMYLAACTKGASSKSCRQQPYNHIPAKQRAYSLKTTYMTRLLRKYVFGTDEDEHIIKDWRLLKTASFDDVVLNMFSEYLELSTREIAKHLGLIWSCPPAKNINANVTRKILGITGDPDRAEEFKNANIAVKTIVVDRNNHPEQNMSFPGFSFLDILDQEWEDSDVYWQMAASRFLFVVFERENTTEIPVLKKVFFWNMPTDDIEELQRVWQNTKTAIRNGAGLHIVGKKVRNSLPKESESYLAHVRSHSDRAAYILSDGTVIGKPEKDANPLPDGQWMTTQCFWFNKSYIQKIIAKAREA